ncbi:protein RMI1-like protein [Trichinella spiralis]|uniref:protein RMI1-like protein n=1 Tax=Trichinella spiralis TaxID=6334 RepID=UPI0001EFD187|nr:protein RMI1-like protein [Trichinella spiralis]
MAPLNVTLLTPKVKLFFEKNHILTLPEWISECLDYLSDELGNDRPSDDEVVDLVYKQWLFSDLREFSLQIFPHNSANTVLNGNYCVQINSLLDVSRSFYSQYQSFTGKLELDDSENDDENRSNEKTDKDRKNCRMIVLELTDGITTLRAMEYHPIPQLELNLMPGSEQCADESWQGKTAFVSGSALLNQTRNWPDWNRATNDDRMLEPEQACGLSTTSTVRAPPVESAGRSVGSVAEVDLFDADQLIYDDLPPPPPTTTNLHHSAEHSTSGDEAERSTPELSTDLYGDIADFFPENEPEFMEMEPENLTYLSTNVARVQLENNATLCIEHDISNGIQMKCSSKFQRRNFVYIAEIISEQFTASQGEYTLRVGVFGGHWLFPRLQFQFAVFIRLGNHFEHLGQIGHEQRLTLVVDGQIERLHRVD